MSTASLITSTTKERRLHAADQTDSPHAGEWAGNGCFNALIPWAM